MLDFVNDMHLQLSQLLPEFATTLTLVLALLLDKIFGEARQFHYLVGFGNLANKIEAKFNSNTAQNSAAKSKVIGLFSWCLLVLPLPIIYFIFISELTLIWQVITDAIILYLAIGLNSLHKHAMQVYQPLMSGNLAKARHYTGYLVSRETSTLSEQEMSRATIESMLENGHDSAIATLVYYLIGGAPLVILHRFANTLDAMWGYKNIRFIHFGYASARLDDIFGFISGKCCTLLYAIQGLADGHFILALKNAVLQGNQYKSHNGGWVMAAGATVLNKTLGGSALYHGKLIQSVQLGTGTKVSAKDIPKSLLIVSRACYLFIILVFSFQLVLRIQATY